MRHPQQQLRLRRFHVSRKQLGFTLIELLVVMVVIAILIALLVPAVQAIRETANRMGCQNNLGQLGKAILTYEKGKGVYPPSKTDKYTFYPLIFPEIEQLNLQNEYDLTKGWKDNKNKEAIKTRLAIAECPSTSILERVVELKQDDATVATSDYSVVTSVIGEFLNQAGVERPSNIEALMVSNGEVRHADVRDGVSSTMLLTEDSGRPGYWITGRVKGPQDNDDGCGNLDVTGNEVRGAGWANTNFEIPTHGFSEDGLSCHGACFMNCTNNNEAYSFHPGGVNIVLADGSVHFLNEGVAPKIWAALVTRDGGDVVPGNAF